MFVFKSMYIYISIQIYNKYMNIEKMQRNIKAVLIENIYKRSQDNRSEWKKKLPEEKKEKEEGSLNG